MREILPDLTTLSDKTVEIYDRNAARFDRERPKKLHEKVWLDRFLHPLPECGRILDLGCGAGDPIAAYMISRGFAVTGIDASGPMLEIARQRHPEGDWHQQDMRSLQLCQRFDGIIGWNSFFHLRPKQQRATLPRLADHLKPEGVLMLTVGPDEGEVVGRVGDDPIYHGSLTKNEYKTILAGLGLNIIRYVAEDPDCDFQTILLAKKQATAS